MSGTTPPSRPFLSHLPAGRTDAAEVLRRLELTVTHRLDGLLQGDHLGLVPGHGSDLGETRGYQPGDDVRRIDWNVTARMQSPHVRETIADRELETWVVVDLSPSLDFGTADCTKRELAVAATAAVGFLTSHTGNRIGGVLLDPTGERVFPARGGRDHLISFLHQLTLSPPAAEGSTDLATALRRLGAIFRRRGLVVVISDFLDGSDWAQAIGRLAVRQDILAIEIVDPRELELPDVGIVALEDPETGQIIEVDTGRGDFAARYATAAAAEREAHAAAFRAARADHLVLRTDRDWVRDVVHFVAARRQRLTGTPRVMVGGNA